MTSLKLYSISQNVAISYSEKLLFQFMMNQKLIKKYSRKDTEEMNKLVDSERHFSREGILHDVFYAPNIARNLQKIIRK